MANQVRDQFQKFISADTVSDVEASFASLLEVTGTSDLRGHGYDLFKGLRAACEPELNFKQKKLFSELEARYRRSQTAASQLGRSVVDLGTSKALVCGAGPVGLRVAVEAQMLGFQVTVVEKRTDFSRANIITFWKETMDDILSLAARTYCPNIVTAGDVRHLGTREVQLVLLKDLLLFGGNVEYGHEMIGLSPPSASGGKWQGCFRPCTPKHVREQSLNQAEHGNEAAAANDAALSFSKGKDMNLCEKGGNQSVYYEKSDPDFLFLSVKHPAPADEVRLDFDAYFIAEGATSDSTSKLGFTKHIVQRKPTIGFVANFEYNKDTKVERELKSFLKHSMSKDFPLKSCPVLAEFVEYLKGETHFYALVCYLENPMRSTSYAEFLKQQEESLAEGVITQEVFDAMKEAQKRMGLIEMGVIKEKRPKATLLAPDNIDAQKLREMGRLIARDCGLPDSAKLFACNPVQIFDFSSLAHCQLPAKILRGDGQLVDGTAEHAAEAAGIPDTALVFPVGDALQQPLWTSGLGVNRGFHGGLNAVYAALLAREKRLVDAMSELANSWSTMSKMAWGDGRLAGGGSGNSGIKQAAEWTVDPRSRLPMGAYLR